MSRIVVGEDGMPCPRCGRPMQVREHGHISKKLLRKPYYFKRWFYCTYTYCATTLVMDERFKVWNDNERARQLRLQQGHGKWRKSRIRKWRAPNAD